MTIDDVLSLIYEQIKMTKKECDMQSCCEHEVINALTFLHFKILEVQREMKNDNR